LSSFRKHAILEIIKVSSYTVIGVRFITEKLQIGYLDVIISIWSTVSLFPTTRETNTEQTWSLVFWQFSTPFIANVVIRGKFSMATLPLQNFIAGK